MNYSGKGAFANKYFNFRTLLLIFVSIPTVVLAGLMSYVMYLVVINNINTLVSMITPNLLVVLMYGTLAVVAVVILILLIAIVKAGGRLLQIVFYFAAVAAFWINVIHLFSPFTLIPHASAGVLPCNPSCGLM